jgi:uncharacterized protein YneF (UPF0154 family)
MVTCAIAMMLVLNTGSIVGNWLSRIKVITVYILDNDPLQENVS